MTIDTLPSVLDIRTESRLTPNQVNPRYTGDAQLDGDIRARITKYRPVIEKKIAGVSDTPDNQLIATQALAKRVEASLWGSAGQLHPPYWERAQALKEESQELVDLLNGEEGAGDADAGVSGGFNLTLTRGDTGSCPEYSRC